MLSLGSPPRTPGIAQYVTNFAEPGTAEYGEKAKEAEAEEDKAPPPPKPSAEEVKAEKKAKRRAEVKVKGEALVEEALKARKIRVWGGELN